jgi:hypothetical protein
MDLDWIPDMDMEISSVLKINGIMCGANIKIDLKIELGIALLHLSLMIKRE